MNETGLRAVRVVFLASQKEKQLRYLHADDGVDEEEHSDQQANVGQCLDEREIKCGSDTNGS